MIEPIQYLAVEFIWEIIINVVNKWKRKEIVIKLWKNKKERNIKDCELIVRLWWKIIIYKWI